MSSSSYLSYIDPHSVDALHQLFTMSGTSQAAAVTSGVVALLLQGDPSLTPDAVKCRLLASSRPAVKPPASSRTACSSRARGSSRARRRHSSAQGCANNGLDIAADLAGTKHFGGPRIRTTTATTTSWKSGSEWGDTLGSGRLYLVAGLSVGPGFRVERGVYLEPGYTWSRGYTLEPGYTWSRGYTGAAVTPGAGALPGGTRRR